ncbi:MAG: asparagine synthase [bacterium]|nr:asparagine synthase [bacterium]
MPTFMVAREARAHVKVALTGDGGDELFAGYTAYLSQAQLRGGRLTSRLARLVTDVSGRRTPYPHQGGSWAREHWREVRSVVQASELGRWLPGAAADVGRFYDENTWLTLHDTDPLSAAFAHDLNYYLPADLLKKVDMAAMLTSLECRAPFLDHRLVEFCLTIPPDPQVAGRISQETVEGCAGGQVAARRPGAAQTRVRGSRHRLGARTTEWDRQGSAQARLSLRGVG